MRSLFQGVHVLVQYIPGPSRGYYILTLGPMYGLYRYLDTLSVVLVVEEHKLKRQRRSWEARHLP